MSSGYKDRTGFVIVSFEFSLRPGQRKVPETSGMSTSAIVRSADNRISLYCAQFGKCAVTGKVLSAGDIHCHHKLPRYLGGTDKYKNLVIVCEDVHRLIHATNPKIIRKYMSILNLDAKQLKKLNKYRSLANVENCLQFDAI